MIIGPLPKFHGTRDILGAHQHRHSGPEVALLRDRDRWQAVLPARRHVVPDGPGLRQETAGADPGHLRARPRHQPSRVAAWGGRGRLHAAAASALGGTLLDRRFIYTDLHRRGIEVCDILGPDGSLVHVKNLESSKAASHLLSQALVSADALLHDEEARSKFCTRVETAGGDSTSIPNPVKAVVLGVARRGRLVSSEHLFTFTQVTLVRQVAALQSRGVDVLVAPIFRPE